MKQIKIVAIVRKTYIVDDNKTRKEVEEMFCEEAVGSVLLDCFSGEVDDELD